MSNATSVTDQLQSFMRGDSNASDALLREILPKLRQIALRALSRERYAAPFSQTELIHELWIGSLGRGGWEIRDRGHFFALVSLAMRRILIDFARKRLALRRGGGNPQSPVPATKGSSSSLQHAEEIAAIGILMERLERIDPEAARMVDMHYFSGFTLEEISCETGLSLKQVRLRWERGVLWLKNMLRATPPSMRGSRLF